MNSNSEGKKRLEYRGHYRSVSSLAADDSSDAELSHFPRRIAGISGIPRNDAPSRLHQRHSISIEF